MGDKALYYLSIAAGVVALALWSLAIALVVVGDRAAGSVWLLPYALATSSAALGLILLTGPFTARVFGWSSDVDRRFKQFEYERDRVQALAKGVASTAAGVLTTLLAAGLTTSARIDAPLHVLVGVVVLAVSLILCGLYGNLSVQRLARTLS